MTEGMIREINKLGIEVMVSFWPYVDMRCEHFNEMVEKGYLIRVERGFRIAMDFQGNTVPFDPTNPEARKYVWENVKENYYKIGVKIFWLDEAEPEYSVYDFENYRYHLGPNLSIGNIFPVQYARAFYEGMEASGQKNIVNLLRCAWAGSQKYGALVWSGDIASSWTSLRHQLAAGLNMGLAGIPWWTTDIGGFHGGDPKDPAFQELFIRWFQWGAFCPVMRVHGDREPKQPQHGTTGGATCLSGAPNEVWSYGDEIYEIAVKYLKLREDMRDYNRSLMKAAHEKGTPVIRPCFYDFPEDEKCWETDEQYMFGPDYLVCPILSPGQSKRSAYLPAGHKWQLTEGSQKFDGGQTVEVESPIHYMPVFSRVH
jgi:alpha-D-xyloside xylohydrolase